MFNIGDLVVIKSVSRITTYTGWYELKNPSVGSIGKVISIGKSNWYNTDLEVDLGQPVEFTAHPGTPQLRKSAWTYWFFKNEEVELIYSS